MQKILITGGCGFVARNVIHLLLKRGTPAENIVAIDNLSVGEVAELEAVCPVSFIEAGATGKGGQIQKGKLTLIEADIRDAAAMERHVSGVDAVVHLAACTGVLPAMKDPLHDCDTNVRGTLNLLEACRHNEVKRFIFASSGAPLGMVEPPVHENLPARPMSPYGASKLAGEGYCSAYSQAFGLEAVSLRFGNLYGPFSSHKGSVVAAFMSAALRGDPLPLEGSGTATRDFIFSEDLCDAIIRACEADAKLVAGETFQISTGDEMSVAELMNVMMTTFKKAGVENVQVKDLPARPVDIQRTYADASKALNVLGWKPQNTLDEGLDKTLAWFQSN